MLGRKEDRRDKKVSRPDGVAKEERIEKKVRPWRF